jgi:Domain of Unknown Function (DUF1206)
VVYLAFFSVAVRVLIGSAGNQTQDQRQATAGVLGWPGGRWLVGPGGRLPDRDQRLPDLLRLMR